MLQQLLQPLKGRHLIDAGQLNGFGAITVPVLDKLGYSAGKHSISAEHFEGPGSIRIQITQDVLKSTLVLIINYPQPHCYCRLRYTDLKCIDVFYRYGEKGISEDIIIFVSRFPPQLWYRMKKPDSSRDRYQHLKSPIPTERRKPNRHNIISLSHPKVNAARRLINKCENLHMQCFDLRDAENYSELATLIEKEWRVRLFEIVPWNGINNVSDSLRPPSFDSPPMSYDTGLVTTKNTGNVANIAIESKETRKIPIASDMEHVLPIRRAFPVQYPWESPPDDRPPSPTLYKDPSPPSSRDIETLLDFYTYGMEANAANVNAEVNPNFPTFSQTANMTTFSKNRVCEQFKNSVAMGRKVSSRVCTAGGSTESPGVRSISPSNTDSSYYYSLSPVSETTFAETTGRQASWLEILTKEFAGVEIRDLYEMKDPEPDRESDCFTFF